MLRPAALQVLQQVVVLVTLAVAVDRVAEGDGRQVGLESAQLDDVGPAGQHLHVGRRLLRIRVRGGRAHQTEAAHPARGAVVVVQVGPEAQHVPVLVAEGGQGQGRARAGDLVAVGRNAVGAEVQAGARMGPQAAGPTAVRGPCVEAVDGVDVAVLVGVELAEVHARVVQGDQGLAHHLPRARRVRRVAVVVVALGLAGAVPGDRHVVGVHQLAVRDVLEIVPHRTVVVVAGKADLVGVGVDRGRRDRGLLVVEVDQQDQAPDLAQGRGLRRGLLRMQGQLGRLDRRGLVAYGGAAPGGFLRRDAQAALQAQVFAPDLAHAVSGRDQFQSVLRELGVADLARVAVANQRIAVHRLDHAVELVAPDAYLDARAVRLAERMDLAPGRRRKNRRRTADQQGGAQCPENEAIHRFSLPGHEPENQGRARRRGAERGGKRAFRQLPCSCYFTTSAPLSSTSLRFRQNPTRVCRPAMGYIGRCEVFPRNPAPEVHPR